MNQVKKFIFLIFVLLSSNANAEVDVKVEDLIGKNLWLSWEEFELECNYTFFEWNEFSSDCSTDEYVGFKIKNFSDGGQSYMDLDPYDSSGNTISHFFYFEEVDGGSDNLISAWLSGDSEKYSYYAPYWDLEEIKYSGSNLIKKERYDFYMAFIDLIILIETSEKDISSYKACKQNIPKEWLAEDYSDVWETGVTIASAMKELPRFSELLQKQKNMDAFGDYIGLLFSNSESGKDMDDYDIPINFYKIKKENFYFYVGNFISVGMGCLFAA